MTQRDAKQVCGFVHVGGACEKSGLRVYWHLPKARVPQVSPSFQRKLEFILTFAACPGEIKLDPSFRWDDEACGLRLSKCHSAQSVLCEGSFVGTADLFAIGEEVAGVFLGWGS
jgi:hypothetical protein